LKYEIGDGESIEEYLHILILILYKYRSNLSTNLFFFTHSSLSFSYCFIGRNF